MSFQQYIQTSSWRVTAHTSATSAISQHVTYHKYFLHSALQRSWCIRGSNLFVIFLTTRLFDYILINKPNDDEHFSTQVIMHYLRLETELIILTMSRRDTHIGSTSQQSKTSRCLWCCIYPGYKRNIAAQSRQPAKFFEMYVYVRRVYIY